MTGGAGVIAGGVADAPRGVVAAAAVGWQIEAVRPPGAHRRGGPDRVPGGARPETRRWVVERTFAWLGRHRRLSKDYEELPATEEAWIYLAMMTVRLAT